MNGIHLGNILDTLLFVLCTRDLFEVVKNERINYNDDYTLMAVVAGYPGRKFEKGLDCCQPMVICLKHEAQWL